MEEGIFEDIITATIAIAVLFVIIVFFFFSSPDGKPEKNPCAIIRVGDSFSFQEPEGKGKVRYVTVIEVNPETGNVRVSSRSTGSFSIPCEKLNAEFGKEIRDVR